MPGTLEITKLLDPIGWRILAELQEDARMQFVELGKRVGLSTPAVIERVRRMEDAGIIAAYRVEIDRTKVGLPVCAFIRVRVIGDFIPRTMAAVRQMPEVFECHRIAGEDTFLLKVCVASAEALEKTIDKLTPYVATTTMLVFSSPVTRRTIEPPQEDAPPPSRKTARRAVRSSGRK
jgi:Lrp/AsnC family leucine-responsive transcriptional regulator